MFENQTALQSLSAENPFRKSSDESESRYSQLLNRLARQVIYGEEAEMLKVERDIQAARRTPMYEQSETRSRGLECLFHLLKGIEAHEDANLINSGAWQKYLRDNANNPTALTREDTQRLFDRFEMRNELIEAEREALTQYRTLLNLSRSLKVELSPKISISREDIEVLALDVSARATERITDGETRRRKLMVIDEELKRIIASMPDEQYGKRFELQEIYLLRKLIHSADTGHLASVSHGTPREDLRPDRGSVDFEVTAGGQAWKFQIKTFKRGVSGQTRANQDLVYEFNAQKLEGSQTHLAVLEQEAVQVAYEASLRQPKNSPTSKSDKYAALEPLLADLPKPDFLKLISMFGLTEKDLAQEISALEEKTNARREQENLLAAKREEELERERNIKAIELAKTAELEAKRLAEEQEKARIEKEANERLIAIADRKKNKQEEVERNLAEAKIREEAKRLEEQMRQAEDARKEALRLKREEKKRNRPDWPPEKLSGLKINFNSLLKQLGLLPEDWTNDFKSFAIAKNKFTDLFAKKDKPNNLFKEFFADKASFENPTADDIARWREAIKQKTA